MKKTFNYFVALTLLAGVATFSSCDETAEDLLKPNDTIPAGTTYDAELVANNTDAAGVNKVVSIDETKTTAKVLIDFKDAQGSMKRMYITENLNGAGDTPFDLNTLLSSKKAVKKDGSLDLGPSSKDSLKFVFDLPVPTELDGTVVYTFWATSGKGDFRDASKRNVIKASSVSLKKKDNGALAVKTYSDVKLFAPAEDGTTESFFSLFNETVYKINLGPEFRAFWDFGYYYTNKAVFASTATFDESFGFPVQGLKPGSDEEDMTNETLNKMYFAESQIDFATVNMSSDLDGISASTSQEIADIKVDDVIEFVDNYGNKGVIKITEIQAGFDNDDFIKFDVKVQP